MWSEILELFQNYMGIGLIVVWYLLSLVFLFLKEEEKSKRILFLYVPSILLFLFFNPLFGKVVYALVGDEIYYRMLWLMPITITLGYCITKAYSMLNGKKQLYFSLVSVVFILISGSCIYQNIHFTKAENIYHMPNAVVEICDAIEVEGREVMAVFPIELVQYVRQYSPVVCMPYGRNIVEAKWGIYNDLFQIMEAEVIDLEQMAPLAKSYGCHYVIISEDRVVKGDFSEYSYILFDQIEGYRIYQDTTIYIGL